MRIATSGRYTFGQLNQAYLDKDLIVNYNYQREFVWSKKLQRSLIVSILKDFPIGSLIIRTEMDNGKQEIVDGQQRTLTIINFINGSLHLNTTHGYDVHEILKKLDNSEERKEFYSKVKSVQKFSDFMKKDQRMFLTNKGINTEMIIGDDNEIKSYFTLVQNQESVKAGEIASNLPSLNIESSILNYEKLDKILEDINFKDNRKEILKLMIADYGYQNGYIKLGTTDEKIIIFAKKMDQENDISKIDELKEHIENILNFLSRVPEEIAGKSKKRFLKLFFIIINQIKKSDYINISKINEINKKLSKYNSKSWRTNPIKFKNNLCSDINIKEDDYKHFENLFYLFSGSNDISDKNNEDAKNNKITIQFWTNYFTKP